MTAWIALGITVVVNVVSITALITKMNGSIISIEKKVSNLCRELDNVKQTRVHDNQFKLEIKHIKESLEKLHNINSVERMARMEEKINSVYDMVNVMLKKQGNER